MLQEEDDEWAMETGGSYILRSNWMESDLKTIRNAYIQLYGCGGL
jgi:hypothetical protein